MGKRLSGVPGRSTARGGIDLPFLAKLAAGAQKVLLPLGGWGLFAAAILDSSFLSLAGGVDLWLIALCVIHPSRMPLYAGAALLGSLIGCFTLYFAARKGEEALLERNRSTARFVHVRQLVEKYGASALFLASILPPPTPFKLCVLAAGLLYLRYGKFLLALGFGRALRYYAEGLLAVRYGHQVWEWMLRSGPVVIVVLLAAAGLVLLSRALRRKAAAVGS